MSDFFSVLFIDGENNCTHTHTSISVTGRCLKDEIKENLTKSTTESVSVLCLRYGRYFRCSFAVCVFLQPCACPLSC